MREKAAVTHLRTQRNRQRPAKPLRSRLPALAVSALCTGIFWCSFSTFAASDSQSQLQNIQQDIARKEKSVQLQKQQRSQLLKQRKSQEQSIAQASRQLGDTQSVLNKLNKDIQTLNASITQLQKQQDKQQALLAKQLDAAFRQGQHNGLQLLLSNEESQRNERMLAYFGYLNDARKQSIDDLKQTRRDLASQKASLQGKQTQQKSLLAQQKTQQQTLESARQERTKTLAALESSLKKDQAQLTELRQNERSLRDKIAQAERAAKARAEREAREAQQVRERAEQAKSRGSTYQPTDSEKALIARTGGLGRPSGQAFWPVRGRTEHRFGEPLQGELRWKGMVIAAAEGTEVKAIADGRVLMADWLQGYGLVVVIEHGKGDMSLYGYNQSALVKVGDQVHAGQPISRVGNSGGNGTPSLYFEIRRQGQAVNPLPWLGR